MNEIIRPTGFDLTKNLHGHVRVETRSRWTGKVIDSQEKDNLVTNAIQKLVYGQMWYKTAGLATWFSPIYEKALGSLVLFGDTLTESANNIFFPNKPPIAIAPYGSNADADGGSLNTSETILTSNGHTAVWDFSTSQANGTIASVARAGRELRANGAYTSQECIFSIGLSSGTYVNVRFLGYDETNKLLYFTPSFSGTISGVTYDTKGIYKVKKDLEKIDLENNSLVFARATLVKTLASSDGTTAAYMWTYDRWANEFIYITGSTLHKVAMDGTHTSSSLSGSGSTSYFAITENYYWRLATNKAYRISKTNLADVTEYSLQDSCYVVFPVGNDIVACCANYTTGTQNIIYADGTIVRKTGLAGVEYSSYGPREIGIYYAGPYSYSNWLYLRNNYLGTIANLDSPVTKTSSQTMKITYTLTEA